MFTQEILFPLHCRSCGNLSYLFIPADGKDIRVLDHLNNTWIEHSCCRFKGHDACYSQSRIRHLEWGIRKLGFEPRKQAVSRSLHPSGVVLELPDDNNTQGFLRVLTLDGKTLDLRVVTPEKNISAGMLIDLTNAGKIGKGKYRVNEIRQIPIALDSSEPYPIDSEFVALSASAADQEQLEAFINRLKNYLITINAYPVSIIPTRLEKRNDQTVYQRIVMLPPKHNLVATLEKYTVSDSIEVAIH